MTVVLILSAMVLGAVIGSFLGAALVRLPDGRSVLTGRSMCDTCDKELAPAELIPIVSWVIQGGKCRECGSAIDRWQLAALASLVDFSAGDPGGLAVVVAVFGGGAEGLPS